MDRLRSSGTSPCEIRGEAYERTGPVDRGINGGDPLRGEVAVYAAKAAGRGRAPRQARNARRVPDERCAPAPTRTSARRLVLPRWLVSSRLRVTLAQSHVRQWLALLN